MPKKQKGNSNNRERHENLLSKTASDDPICSCLELVTKSSLRSTSTGVAVKDESINIDNYAVVHWMDAHKMDIHDGEPALIARSQGGNSFIAIVCNVRISSSALPRNGGISSSKSASPLLSKKKLNQEATKSSSLPVPLKNVSASGSRSNRVYQISHNEIHIIIK